MKKTLIQTIISPLSIAAICYGRLHNIPDSIQRSYGFPFTWGIHRLSSIAGPVDIWNVNVTYLAVDLGLWMVVLLVSQIVFDYKRRV